MVLVGSGEVMKDFEVNVRVRQKKTRRENGERHLDVDIV